MDVQQEFGQRLKQELLPAFCNDPARQYDIAGFRADAKQITDFDARDFLRALDHNVVSVDSGGRFHMPQSKAEEVIFRAGVKSVTPRKIYLWLEPLITIGAVARLHLDYGWPIECLGMQSEKWSFDLMAFKPSDLKNEHIAGEVKSSTNELDAWLTRLRLCCAEPNHDCSAVARRKNAHNKWQGFKRSRPPIFWALGPGGYSWVFDVLYSDGGRIDLNQSIDERLRFC